jgi:hypothetical protein
VSLLLIFLHILYSFIYVHIFALLLSRKSHVSHLQKKIFLLKNIHHLMLSFFSSISWLGKNKSEHTNNVLEIVRIPGTHTA